MVVELNTVVVKRQVIPLLKDLPKVLRTERGNSSEKCNSDLIIKNFIYT